MRPVVTVAIDGHPAFGFTLESAVVAELGGGSALCTGSLADPSLYSKHLMPEQSSRGGKRDGWDDTRDFWPSRPWR